jgi:hypothetical protein
MLVSRKNLSFIHFIASVGSIGSNGFPEPLHQGIVFLGFTRLLCKLDEPFTERVIQSTLLRPGELTGLLDEFFIRTESDIFHTIIVYTNFVYTTIISFSGEGTASRKLCGGA